MGAAFRSVLLSLLAGLTLTAAAADAPARYSLDIPSQKLESALQAVALAMNGKMLYEHDLLDGKVSSRLQGQFTTEEALKALLAGTNLTYEFTSSSVVLIRQRGGQPASSSNKQSGIAPDTTGLRLASAGDSAAAATAAQDAAAGVAKDDETSKSDLAAGANGSPEEGGEVLVTGSRIRTLAGQATANPVFVYTSEDFERSGLNSLGEFRNMIPQLGYTGGIGGTGLSAGLTSYATQTRVDLDLRGLGSTLILVNGRRMARGGQSIGLDTFNPDAIPLSMIERLEVLTAGASALYGADAIGGVVNIILKKNVSGSEFVASYDNTFNDDAAVRTMTGRVGYQTGPFSLMLSGTWRDNNEQKQSDRWFTSLAARRDFPTTNLGTIGGAGSLSRASGTLPGTGVNAVAIPAGLSGGTPTAADYVAAGAVPGRFDLSPIISVINPAIRRNAMVRSSYDFGPGAQLYLDVNFSDATTRYTDRPVQLSNFNIPAGYAGNPFGVPVRLSKIFFDLPRSVRESSNTNSEATLGLQGELGRDWSYDLSGTAARSRQLDEYPGGVGASFNTARLTAAMNNADPALRPILIYDSTTVSSAQQELLESLTTNSPFDDRSKSFDYAFQVTGPLFNLPGGPVSAAMGLEYRLDTVDFLRVDDPFYLQANPDRSVRSAFAEVQVPLISDKNHIPLVNQLGLNLAGRIDEHNDFGTARTPRVGLLYRPVKWLALRGSRSEGFKAPPLYYLYSPFNPQPEWLLFFGPVFDPERGGEEVDPEITVNLGGNPDLKAERSVTYNYGLALDVPFVHGLSLTLDFYDIDYRDRIQDLTYTPDLAVFFPSLLTRGPSTDGMPGPITEINALPVNSATTHTRGYDLQLNYILATAWGQFGLKAGMNNPQRYEFKVTADAAPIELMYPRRISGSVTWSRQALDVSMAVSYQDNYFIDPTQSYIAPSRIEWTPAVAYDFSADSRFSGAQRQWWARALTNTKLSASFPNVFNRSPTVGDAAKTYSSVYDPRLARYILTVQRRF